MQAIKDPNKPPFSNILPPCKVCGEPGTGFHYGVTTCGACKGFFRRSLIRDKPYTCMESQACFVGPGTDRRICCPKCRLEKCIAVGMDKDAIKLGRYSLMKKFQDIEEAEQISAQIFRPPQNRFYPQGLPPMPGIRMEPYPIFNSTTNINISGYPGSMVTPTQNHNTTRYGVEYNHPPNSSNAPTSSSRGLGAQVPMNNPDRTHAGLHNIMDLNNSRFDTAFWDPQHQSTTQGITNEVPSHEPLSSLCSRDTTEPKVTSTTSEIPKPLKTFSDPSDHPPYTNTNNGDESNQTNANPTRTVKRVLGESNAGNPPKVIGSCTQNTEADSTTIKQTSQNVNTPMPISCRENNNEDKPFVFCLVEPDPMKYVISIFDKFPFKCFEKENLAPLLNLCYNKNDWLGEYLLPLDTKKRETPSTGLQELLENTSAIVKADLAHFSQTQELPNSAQDLTYDAEEMEQLFSHIKTSFCHYWGSESSYLSRSEKQMYMKMFQKMCQLQDSLQGSLNLIDDDIYFEVLNKTGVDVDKRKLWFSCTFANFDDVVAKDSKFFLTLPGFKDLPLCDRVSLTKGTSMLYAAVMDCETCDNDSDVFMDEARGIATRISSLMRLLPNSQDMSKTGLPFMKYMKELELSFDELVLLKALIIVLPNFCDDLQAAGLVKNLHISYLKCLLHLARQTHKEKGDDRFNKILFILQTMTKMRDMWAQYKESGKDSINKLVDKTKQPILNEIWGDVES